MELSSVNQYDQEEIIDSMTLSKAGPSYPLTDRETLTHTHTHTHTHTSYAHPHTDRHTPSVFPFPLVD